MLPYFPALRFKKGEYFASAKLPPDVQQHVVPRFIVPPPKETDPETGRVLTYDEIGFLTGDRIGSHWPMRPAFLDLQYAESELEDEGIARLFDIARSRNPNLIPVVNLGSIQKPLYGSLLGQSNPKVGIHVPFDDVDPDVLAEAVKSLGCDEADCVVFVDFTAADMEPSRAAGSISAIFDMLGQTGKWRKIVFQGSVFPMKNPAESGENFLVSRQEWMAFHAAMSECVISPDRIGFGDYCADCGEINFPRGQGGGRAIRHFRYTTDTDTLVVRGKASGSDSDVMREVSMRVIKSGHFSGRAFSYADDMIWRIAHGHSNCGNASMWREWNTTHHIMHVVRALGRMSGIRFSESSVSEIPKQMAMFND